MEPEERRWSAGSDALTFLSESRDRLSSMQALSGSGVISGGNDVISCGAGEPPVIGGGLASRRVAALRQEYAKRGKSLTVSESELNYSRSAAASQNGISPANSHTGLYRSVNSGKVEVHILEDL
jgi:hypothetical protein